MANLIVLNESVAAGFKSAAGGFNTTIVEGGGGYEVRNQNWVYPRRRYEFSFVNRDAAIIQEVMEFVDDRRGSLHAWLLKDWGNYILINEVILVAVGGETQAQIRQTWGPDNALSLPRKHIKAGTLTVRKNSLILDEGDDYTTDSLGMITFTAPLAAANVISVTCQFYHRVRFEADGYAPSLDGTNASWGSVTGVSAIEVRV